MDTNMNDQKKVEKFLKIVGVAVLVAVPIFFLVKKLRSSETQHTLSEDPDIFAEELSE